MEIERLSKDFFRHEFACRCGCGFADINPGIVRILQQIRTTNAQPLVITSGCRCKEYNAEVGGAPDSKHLLGMAADIRCTDSRLRYFIHYFAWLNGVTRIGIYPTFIHIDLARDPNRVVWIGK